MVKKSDKKLVLQKHKIKTLTWFFLTLTSGLKSSSSSTSPKTLLTLKLELGLTEIFGSVACFSDFLAASVLRDRLRMMEGLSSSELKLRGAAFGGTGGAKLATGPVPKAPSLKLVSGPCSLVRQVSGLKQITKVRFVADFCLRPSAKDQGITRVVLVLHHYVNFLI